jgi:hypothetical protein
MRIFTRQDRHLLGEFQLQAGRDRHLKVLLLPLILLSAYSIHIYHGQYGIAQELHRHQQVTWIRSRDNKDHISRMKSINRFIYGPSPEEKVREWQRKLRQEERSLEREVVHVSDYGLWTPLGLLFGWPWDSQTARHLCLRAADVRYQLEVGARWA